MHICFAAIKAMVGTPLQNRVCIASTNVTTIIMLFIYVAVVDFRLTPVGSTAVYRNLYAFLRAMKISL